MKNQGNLFHSMSVFKVQHPCHDATTMSMSAHELNIKSEKK